MTGQIEKLEAELSAARGMRQRIDIQNALAWELRDKDTQRGLELAQSAYQLAENEGYKKGLADSLVAQCQYIFNNYILALSQGTQALTIFEQIGDRTGQSRALFTLCWAHWSFDNFIEAVELGQRAQQLAQETGDLALEADVLNNLGLAYKRSGNYELGYTVYNKALSIYRSLGDRMREGKVLTNIALAYAKEGRYERALEYGQESLRLEVKNPLVDGYTFLVLGQAHAGLNNFDEAMPYLHQTLAFAKEHRVEQLVLAAMESIGEIYLAQERPDLAIDHLQKALAMASEIKSSLNMFRCHELLSQMYERQGDFDLALRHYKEFHSIKENLFNDKNTNRLQILETHHRSEIARREAEIYQLRNVELEKEIVEHKRLQDQLQQQATTDVLTGAANRRHFINLAGYELKRSLRFGHSLALALIDIDHFKHINDSFGHATGDEALIEFTRIIKNNIREIDLFARFGGDEFVLLLPQTKSEQAFIIVERIRHVLTAKPIVLAGSLVDVTVSAGITSFAGKQDGLDHLLGRADKALYQAKAAGRNQVCIEEP